MPRDGPIRAVGERRFTEGELSDAWPSTRGGWRGLVPRRDSALALEALRSGRYGRWRPRMTVPLSALAGARFARR